MQGTGKTYEHSGQTTEWDDILIKKGITTKEEILIGKGLNPADFIKKEVEVAEESPVDKLENLDLDQLDELEDDPEYADSNLLDEYRQSRLNQLKQSAFKNRFGEVVEIVKDEWLREVTESSNNCAVVVHLYENSSVECQLVDEALIRLANKFKYVKFLKIKSTQAVENWPERNLPTLFIYENGALKSQLMTLKEVGGKTMNVEDLEWFLASKGVVTDSELDENPRDNASSRKQVFKTSIHSSHLRSAADSDHSDEDI